MSVIIWYVSTSILGFVGFTFTRKVIGFPDKGYAFARIFGLLIVSYSLWLFTYIYKLSPNFVLAWSIACALFVLCFSINLKFIKILNSSCIRLILFEEALFIVLFILMLLFRASTPMITNIEKFMDYGIINGIVRGSTIPPVDIWFSGKPINYYYFGHFSIATLFKLTRVPAGVSYNIAVSYVMAISGTAGFSIMFALTKKYLYSFIGTLIFVAGGNLDSFYNKVFLQKSDYFYAQARSLIPYTINEFPAYSFLIGDLHAHILNIPNVLLFLALLISIFNNIALLKQKVFLMCLVLSLGVLGVTNSWDFIIYMPLMILIASFSVLKDSKSNLILVGYTVIKSLIITIVSILVFFPFYLNFKTPATGFVFIKPEVDLVAIFRMFGFFIISILPAYYIFRFKKPSIDENNLNLILSLFGFLLILVSSFFVVKDIYFKLNPPYFRANTIFKLWYQAWILLSICVPYSIKVTQEHLKANITILRLHTLFIGVLLFFVFGYTIDGIKYIVGPSYISKGLDGTIYLKDSSIITWINAHVKGQPVLLEAAGKSYSSDSVVSSYTGLPTLIGWSEHELGWRNNWETIANRMGDIEKIYKGTSIHEVKELVQKYNIKYVILGEKEKARYGPNAGVLLKKFSTVVMYSEDSELLLIRYIP